MLDILLTPIGSACRGSRLYLLSGSARRDGIVLGHDVWRSVVAPVLNVYRLGRKCPSSLVSRLFQMMPPPTRYSICTSCCPCCRTHVNGAMRRDPPAIGKVTSGPSPLVPSTRSHDILGLGGELTTLGTGVGIGSQSRTATTTKASSRREPRAYRIARARAMLLLPRCCSSASLTRERIIAISCGVGSRASQMLSAARRSRN